MKNSPIGRIKENMAAFFNKINEAGYTKSKLNRKNKIITALVVTIMIALVSTALATQNNQMAKQAEAAEDSLNAYKVFFGDHEVGIVSDTQTAIDVLQSIEKELFSKNDLKISIDQDLKFEEFFIKDEEITIVDNLRNNIKSHLTYKVYAYGFYINGERFGVLKSKDELEELIEKVKEPYIKMANEKGSEIEDIYIVEDVEIKEEKVDVSSITDFDTLLALVQKGTTEEKIHIVEKNENYWVIARKYNLTVNDLIKANPEKNYKLIHPGDELNLIVPKPYLTVATYEFEKSNEKIDYEKKVEYTASLYSDQRTIKTKGVYGEKEVFAKVVKHNGVVVDKEVLKEVVLSDPKPQVELQGTKKLPPKKGTGVFMRPTRGTLTSGFGMRWGKMHNGIDLASRIGTPIKAADGGVVTYAGWKGTYGYMVEIDHGAGFKTRYAHCSKIYVKVGEKVYKDKTIAAVGDTGRSTGPHLHFEVLKHGVPQNPLNYIGKQYR